MCDVLVGVAAGREPCVQLLEVDPLPTGIVGSAQNEPTSGFETLQSSSSIGDSFGTCSMTSDDRTQLNEASGNGKLEAGRVHERNAEATVEAKLTDEDVKSYAASRQRLDYRLDPQPTSRTGPSPAISSLAMRNRDLCQ